MSEVVLTNAEVVTRDRSFHGTVSFDGRVIRAVDEGRSALAGAIDCEGDLVIPGLIEMHTDNVERHMEPRPGVLWPSALGALNAHDVQMAGAGITTVLDAISVGDYHKDGRRRLLLQRTVEGLEYGQAHDAFRAEHGMHLRCEVSDSKVMEMFEPYADNPLVRLVSVMDHTPGQRQWHDLEMMRAFHSRRKTYSDEEFEEYVRMRREAQERFADRHRREVIERWRPRGLPMASHDDTTTEHVDESVADGITIAEFPTTLDAATHAHARGMSNVMGAPNLVRGGSHSGNVSAHELAGQRILHALSSDYVPASLLHGALMLDEEHGYELHDAIAVVTANVAGMLGLGDRGAIAPGLRADLVRVRRLPDGSALVRGVWREGRRVS